MKYCQKWFGHFCLLSGSVRLSPVDTLGVANGSTRREDNPENDHDAEQDERA